MSQARYQFDHEWILERERLSSLERVCDPSTIRTLQEIGVSAKWHCLEVGGGGGSIAEWLCRKVEAAGRVVATDIDIKFLTALNYPNLEVLEHNLISDELQGSDFDLVHERSVLAHLAEREDALKKLANAVKPGQGVERAGIFSAKGLNQGLPEFLGKLAALPAAHFLRSIIWRRGNRSVPAKGQTL